MNLPLPPRPDMLVGRPLPNSDVPDPKRHKNFGRDWKAAIAYREANSHECGLWIVKGGKMGSIIMPGTKRGADFNDAFLDDEEIALIRHNLDWGGPVKG